MATHFVIVHLLREIPECPMERLFFTSMGEIGVAMPNGFGNSF